MAVLERLYEVVADELNRMSKPKNLVADKEKLDRFAAALAEEIRDDFPELSPGDLEEMIKTIAKNVVFGSPSSRSRGYR